ncbi:hypothetical protein [Phenylobacterium sp.]|jgi:hypothetical protein|uniref:hypothetical protein n=1 Tax=Phenylobacterium sp. TaxID=1871053 RepID=UPI0037CC7230
MTDTANVVVATRVTYYHPNDEAAFFDWLARMECVEGFDGAGRDLFIRLKRRPTKHDLQELLAFCFRYGIDLAQLAKFERPSNKTWLRDPQKYWHGGMFGEAKVHVE